MRMVVRPEMPRDSLFVSRFTFFLMRSPPSCCLQSLAQPWGCLRAMPHTHTHTHTTSRAEQTHNESQDSLGIVEQTTLRRMRERKLATHTHTHTLRRRREKKLAGWRHSREATAMFCRLAGAVTSYMCCPPTRARTRTHARTHTHTHTHTHTQCC